MKELLQQALDVLESYNAKEFGHGADVMQSLRAAIAQGEPWAQWNGAIERRKQSKAVSEPVSEPVAFRAWFDADNGARWLFTLWPEEEKLDVVWQPLYAAPVGYVPLSDEQIDSVTVAQWGAQPIGVMLQAHRAYARAIERAIERAVWGVK